MTDFFIADMHFHGGGTNSERLARARGFPDAAAMNAAICNAWQQRVGEGDTVWVVGDVGDPAPLTSLPGKKHLLLGNTDTPVGKYRTAGAFDSVSRSHALITDTGEWLLIHRPEDAPTDDARPVVHGHIHAKSWPDPRFVCVSVDQTDWGPISAAQLVSRLATQGWLHPDNPYSQRAELAEANFAKRLARGEYPHLFDPSKTY